MKLIIKISTKFYSLKAGIRLYIVLFVFVLASCSRESNNAYVRFHHNLNTYYNVYFNQKESFEAGMQAKREAYQYNYNGLLPIYLPLEKAVTSAGTSAMERSIKKGVKAVSLRSIKSKPDYGLPYSQLDDEQKAFYNKNEYNAFMDEVHLYMAEAYFYENKLDSARLQYQFVSYEFPKDVSANAAYLGMARVAIEEQTYQLAEYYLNLANQKQANNATIDALAGCYAHLYLKQGEFKKAIPHLKEAVRRSSATTREDHLLFNLGRIYTMYKKYDKAAYYYQEAIDQAENYELILYAQVELILLPSEQATYEKSIADLLELLESDRNYDYQYKIYDALGHLAVQAGKLEAAVEYYKYAIKSNKNNPELKLSSSLNLGDLFFDDYNFAKALEAYQIAVTGLKKTHPYYASIKRKLANLQRLAELSGVVYARDEIESHFVKDYSQGGLLDDVVLKPKKREEESSIFSLFGYTNSGEWYFYNKQFVEDGKQEFQDKWGALELLDDWKFSNKRGVISFEDEPLINLENFDTEVKLGELKVDSVLQDSVVEIRPKKALPPLEEAVLELADIYHYRVELSEEAKKVYYRYVKNFPQGSRLAMVYYQLVQLSEPESEEWQQNRDKLITNYPRSVYAQMVKGQSSKLNIYNQRAVHAQKFSLKVGEFVSQDYTKSLSERLSVGKYSTPAAFVDVVAQYQVSRDKSALKTGLQALTVTSETPEDSVLNQRITDLLAGINQSEQPAYQRLVEEVVQQEERVDPMSKEELAKLFSFNREERHLFVTLFNTASYKDINLFKFELNTFNIEEAENIDLLVKSNYVNRSMEMVSVGVFEDMRGACFYLKEVMKSMANYESLAKTRYVSFVISESNMVKMMQKGLLDAYIQYFFQNYNNISF